MEAIKYSILSFCLVFLLTGASVAQNIDQIYMKSGSVVEGYISEQIPGKYITIQTIKATIVVNSDSLRNSFIEKVPLDSLCEEWQVWAIENGRYVDDNGIKQIEMAKLEFQNCSYSGVYLLEKGSLIKFLDLSPGRYRFVWGDMYRTVKSKRPENLFSGLKEIVVLNDNTKFVGQIIEQFPGKDLKIVTDSGEIFSFKYSQVKQINTEKIAQNFDIWSQLQFLDKITVQGESEALVGFISSRTLGKDLVFEFEGGGKRNIPQNLITSYAKIPNQKYVAVYDKVLKEGEILLNDEPAYFVNLEAEGEYLLLSDTVSAQYCVGDSICIYAKLANPNASITLVKACFETFVEEKGKKKEEVVLPVITYQDLLQSKCVIKRETTPLGNVKVTFVVDEPGDYVVYIQGKNEYIVINVIDCNIQ